MMKTKTSKLYKEIIKINIAIFCLVLALVILGGAIYLIYPNISNLLCFVVDVFCLGLNTGFLLGRWRRYGKN